jgi:hypothetical protein
MGSLSYEGIGARQSQVAIWRLAGTMQAATRSTATSRDFLIGVSLGIMGNRFYCGGPE